MASIDAVFFDCDGTLVDSEMLCARANVEMFRQVGITVSLDDIFKRFKGVKLNEIIESITTEHHCHLTRETLEPVYRTEVARLFDTELLAIDGARELLTQIHLPMCIVSNGPVTKMQHSLGKTGMLSFFTDRLFSGYTIQCWKPDPGLMYYAAREMGVSPSRTILVDDSLAGAQAGIAAGMQVFYLCADPHNPPITHPLVTTFTQLSQLPVLWQNRGWSITS